MYNNNHMTRFDERIACTEDTKYKSKIMGKVDDSVKSVYKNENFTKKYSMSNVRLIDIDVVDCAIKCKIMNPIILNFTDEKNRGGCSGDEEESLFRRTNYCQSLLKKFYPILEGEAVYSPNISVIKTSEATNWISIPDNEVPKISFVACPTLKYINTYVSKRSEIKMHSKDVEILKNKIKLTIQVAIENRHDTIIFGGCCEPSAPIKHVAEIFKRVLIECDGVILNYYFAMSTETHRQFREKERSKIEIFSDVFGIPISLFKNH